MTDRQSILFILLPQSLRRITPPLTNEVITLVKSSSLLSVISITELTRSAQVIIAERFTPFELYAELAVYYLVIISVLSWFSEYVEKRLHDCLPSRCCASAACRRSLATYRWSIGSIWRSTRARSSW